MRGQLTRSETDRKLAGVAGGMAEYFGLDPTLVRVGWVVAGLMGWGLLAYVIQWSVVPRTREAPAGAAGSAVRIAEERFARGEISAEELAGIRRDLEGRP
ncbi:MAG: PspC domain-containing protein [Actinobacteria bacterium]|nr:PspC domain-containing protein [Actinomycetota bacterium]